MCDNAHNHSHVHGVRSDAEKALADLREDLSLCFQLLTKYESQRAVIATADFPAAGQVVHVLEHLMEDQKRHVAELMRLIVEIDPGQRRAFDSNGHHEHTHTHAHGQTHEHSHSHS